MADRYWVGGTGTWNSSSTTNWSATPGGAGGASVPTSVDSVFFDSDSAAGAFTVTISGNVNCLIFAANPTVSKVLTLNSGVSDSLNVYGTTLNTGLSGELITSGFNGWVNIYGNTNISGNAVLKNTLFTTGVNASIGYNVTTVASEIKLSNGCVVTIKNDFKVNKITGLSSLTTPQLKVGHAGNTACDLYVKGDSDAISGAISFICNYSGTNIYLEPSSSSITLNLGLGGFASSFNKITLKPLSSGTYFTIKGSVYFSDFLKEAGTPSCVLQFDPTASIQFENFNASGDVSNTLFIQSSVDGVRASPIKTGGGTVVTNYVEVKDMQPSSDDTWISYNSTNAGNNFRWYFDDFEKPTSNLFFGNAL